MTTYRAEQLESLGTTLQLYVWTAVTGTPKAWVQILHGMSEHAARYDRFAQALNKAGYLVVAHDHRGHGKTGPTLGNFGPDGWNSIISDVTNVREHIKVLSAQANVPNNLPCFLFAHSMGSFVGQKVILTDGPSYKGVVLSGSDNQGGLILKAGLLAAKLERARLGGDLPSSGLTFLSFGSFNGQFKPNRTHFDWLSRDPKEVDAYVTDPTCGVQITTESWVQMLTGLIELGDGSWATLRKDLPILIFGGQNDPVGKNGAGLRRLYDRYRSLVGEQVSIKVFENGRHEMLNETNRDEVTKFVIDWLDQH